MRCFLVVAMAGLSLSVFGETYTWTGAVDSYWTNRANWTVGGAVATEFPGVATAADHFNGDGTLTDKGRAALGATAVFGALAAGGAKTVDLDGLYSIGNVTVASGAPAYTFGTSADQVLPLESRATAVASANLFLIEEGAELPVFVAGLSFGSAQEGTGRTYLRIKNCVAGTQLVLPSVGHTRILPGNAKGNPWVMFDGVGGFRFEGPFEDIACYSGNNRQYPDILFYGTGKVTVATEMFGGYKTENYCLRQFYNEAGMTLEILEDCTFFPVSHYNFEMPITVNGSGTLGFDGGSYVLVSPAKTATINCDFEVMRSSESLSHDFKLYSWAGKDAGTLNMYGTVKGLTGTFTMDTPSTYRVNKVANFGEGANVVFMRPGVFDYAGAEADAAFGKSISIAAACTPTFSNSGSTELVVSSEISATVADAGFAFAPATGPIRFTGSFADGNAIGLVKNGAGKLAFSTDVGNVARTTLNGGEVEVFRGADPSVTLPAVSVSGACRLTVSDGVRVTLDDFETVSGGSLDIYPGEDAVVCIPELADRIAAPGILYRGYPADVGADGTVVVSSTVVGQIGARGQTIASGTDDLRILSQGTTGSNVLAADAVTIPSLTQDSPFSSVLALADGQVLTAGSVVRAKEAAALAIGDVAGRGTLSSSGDLTLANADERADLEIRADVAPAGKLRTGAGDGTVVLAGGSTSPLSVDVPHATLKLTGERSFDLTGDVWVGTNASSDAKLVVDGAKDVVLGAKPFLAGCSYPTREGWRGSHAGIARMVVTNALIRNEDTSISTFSSTVYNERALVVGAFSKGILDIEEGAVISNRLLVGMWFNTSEPSCGAVFQHGGEMAMLSDKSNIYLGSAIGNTCDHGSYVLDGGRLVALGQVGVGGYSTGVFVQNGGELVVTNTLDGGAGGFCVGYANSGKGHACFRGGVAHISRAATLINSRASTSASSTAALTVSGSAYVDAFDAIVKSFGQSAANGNTHASDYNLNGGTLRLARFKRNIDGDADLNVVRVNFNGGAIRCGTDEQPLFENFKDANDRVFVYAGGATIDTAGRKSNKVNRPMVAPTGNGVVSVPLPGPITGFTSVPYVGFDGDGVGASAIAEFDEATLTVTNITITCPGVNYTWARVWLTQRNQSGSFLYDCVLAPNSSGSFTKAGAGDLTLEAANGWGGDTVLAGGTLVVGCAGAIPATSKIVLAGGALDAGAYGATLPADWSIDCASALSTGPIACPGDLAFPEGAVLTLENAPQDPGDETASIVLLEADGVISGSPQVRGFDADLWHCRVGTKRITLRKNSGMTVIIR